MIGLWRHDQPKVFGSRDTYVAAAKWLEPCRDIADWGCGQRGFEPFIGTRDYLGIDGSGPHADVVADLVEYRGCSEGILLRHVLEHNEQWRDVLRNALDSFWVRMVVVLSVRPGEVEEVLWREDGSARRSASGPIPTIRLPAEELADLMHPLLRAIDVEANETIYYIAA